MTKINEVNMREIERAIERLPSGWWKLIGPGAASTDYGLVTQTPVPELLITHDQKDVLYLLFVAQPQILLRLIAAARESQALATQLQATQVAAQTLHEDLGAMLQLLIDVRWMVQGIADRNSGTGKAELARLDAIVAKHTAQVH